MRKFLIAAAFLALALPVAASAETITTGVSNSVGSSVFCGTLTANSVGVYNAGGTSTTDTWANKNVTSGFDNAGVGTPSSSTVVVTHHRGDRDNDDKGNPPSKTTTTTSNPGNGASTGLNGITENSGSSSHTVLSFSQNDTTGSYQSGYLTQFSANSSVSSFVSTGI